MKALVTGSVLLAAVLLVGTGYGGGLERSTHTGQTRYRVTNLPSLDGSSSSAESINNRGWIAGRANLPGDRVRHATLWRHGSIADLGTLGSPERNSGVFWPVKNVRGIVAGISQTDEPDPLNERWSCAAFFPAATATGYRCVGFKWEDGEMTPLPTLGGTHGFATGANNRGQVVGWAENTVHDSTCELPQRLQFRAVVWGPGRRQIRELPPLAGDTVSAATALNDSGQVIGISGICDQAVGRFSARHAVLWEDGKPIDIGDLGGTSWHTPMAINQRGDIVGFGNVSPADGGELKPHGFIWTRRHGLVPIRPLQGDVTAQALGINERRQVVGTSCDAEDNCRAFLWERGVATDLNTLAGGYDDVLTTANDIDDRGRIAGQAFDDDSGRFVAFVAKPRR